MAAVLIVAFARPISKCPQKPGHSVSPVTPATARWSKCKAVAAPDLLAAEHPNLASAEAARLDAPGLSVETRRALANLPAYQVLLGDEAISLLTAASRVVAGLRAALINGKPDLLELPTQLLVGFSPKLFPPAGEHDRDS